MLSFMLPNEEKGFNLNAVAQNEAVFQVTNGHSEVKTELSGDPAAPPAGPARGSPNNNSHPVLETPLISASLDNMPPPQPPPPPAATAPLLSRDLSLMEDSYSDDAATESTLLLRADERADEVMTPSTENTRSSPCGDEKPLLPVTTVSGKTGKLKRVSFGSSKGSMVETVVYDYEPVQTLREEEGCESPDPRASSRHNFATSTPLSAPATRAEPSAAERAASRVRVTYFESKKPLPVPAPDPADVPTPEEFDVPAPPPGHTQVTAAAGEMPTTYIVQTMDAGWENPFRPGGELSKEADQIVRAIQSGRPLDSSLDEADAPPAEGPNGHVEPAPNGSAPAAAPGDGRPDGPADATRRNGASAPAPQVKTAVAAQQPGTVEVQHTLVKPEDASQVEQVTLKKKPRGKCCVVQ
ncbi:fibrous sheath CABYR-binding protein-like [Pollicipes pollicipes]|uniref:fibrous sheath CABYR-binding protein-like n=1 Tax=Pollicipes pollicipes TaxID=41117 RepID=UPI001884CF48|nr:fibrous sheath CABYR-binding protein-like [Pollicipes pollicipes]